MMALINLSAVQTFLAQRATKILSEKLKTTVRVAHVRIDLFNHILLEGVYIADQQKDTLAYIGKAQVRMTDWFFVKNTTTVLHYVGIENAYVHLYRKANSSTWNYAFIEDAFASNDNTKSNKQPAPLSIDLKKLMLDNIRFHFDDAWIGYDYDIDIGAFAGNVDDIDFKKKHISVSSVAIKAASVRLHDYPGGRPPKAPTPDTIDRTPFNTYLWTVNIKKILLDNCHFAFVSKETPAYPNEFDPEHIDVKNINSEINQISIIADTIKGKIEHFSAHERSGFIVHELQSKVSVSPIASICKELFIQTNRSTIGDYYAMHYNRFPDFLDYISKVKMVAQLKEANVDMRDIAFFAPQVKAVPLTLLKVSGNGSGTVDRLSAQNISITDGFSNAKGDIRINGLPDVDKTYFELNNGNIFTTGLSILKYAPSLQKNPNIAIKTIDYAYFKGSFAGLLSDFAVKGNVSSNLGNINAAIQMKLPEHAKPTYSGTISTQSFNIGTLFNQPTLGTTSCSTTLQGASFDVDGIHIKANATFKEFTFNNYTYKNISADGSFDDKKFDGKLLINDSNIAMGFYGNIDFSQKDITVNAKANLLEADLQALHFTSIPSTLSGDFDLNCAGNNIDEFIGTAKLYNINLTRKAKRLDLDSINIQSSIALGEKRIEIESNLLSANVNGQFLLSEIPNATMYFLGKYLPNYIKSTKYTAADQNINFNIKTHAINDLVMAFSDVLSGFDNALFVGNLNTFKQSLSVVANVPYGKIGSMRINNASISGNGNYEQLQVKSTIQKLIIGNNVLNTSLSLDAAVGNDSLLFSIATKSDEQYGTATLNGKIYASKDTLYGSLLPSELYLNNKKWEIPSGNQITYANNYLYVDNFIINSGLQQITANSDNSRMSNPLVVRHYNIDIAELASLTSLSSYQPEGRINGIIQIDNLFNDAVISSNLEAVGVKFLNDTVGMIKLKGNYLPSKQSLTIDATSGIFNNKFSLTTQGNIALNANSAEQINGNIQIANFPAKFIEPFIKGYVSKMGGTIDGQVTVKGSANKPFVEGNLKLRNIIARIDYLGTLYSIPQGIIKIDNQTASLDNIEVLDVFKNKAYANGYVRFDKLNDPKMNIKVSTDQFEVVNLNDYENDLFYGHVIAKTNFNILGLFSNMNMSIVATPTQKSKLYIPYNAAGDISSSTYISFKTYGKTIAPKQKPQDKLNVNIEAVLNPYLDLTLVLDPKSGDQITATGNGNLSIKVPANEDYSLFGTYNIDKGSYTFTYRQVLSKTFNITTGSSVSFMGNISNTSLNVHANYPTSARLYDLLDPNEASQIKDTKDLEDAKTSQIVNILLNMTGTLANPTLAYEIELPEKRSLGTLAHNKLMRINQSDKTNLTNQVSSLLFLGSFMPSQGITSTLISTGAKTTLGETFASQASPLLTKALTKLIGDPKLNVTLQYKNIGQDASSNSNTSIVDSRNVVKFGLGRNYFNDRLKLQVGSAYDWGRPTNNNQTNSNFNLAGDFRAQYLLSPDGGVSLVGFRASNYDLYYGYNITRTGVGVSVRKSFDNLFELFHSKKRLQKERKKREEQAAEGKENTM